MALALAVYSAVMMKPMPEGIAVFAEVGLAGEVRSVSQSARRITEAQRSGLQRLIAPPGTGKSSDIVAVKSVREAIRAVWG